MAPAIAARKRNDVEEISSEMDGIRIDSGVPSPVDHITTTTSMSDDEEAVRVNSPLYEVQVTAHKGYGLVSTCLLRLMSRTKSYPRNSSRSRTSSAVL
jgi:hypothetical protein